MIDLLRSRRSIRAYEARPIEPEKVATIREAVLRCPSSKGLKPGEFVFVDDRGVLKELAGAREHRGEFIAQCALAVVVCADERKNDVWVEDCSIAAIVAQLTAHDLGLGSCWVQIRNRERDDATTAEEAVQATLGIPPHMRVECIVAIGYPAEKKEPVPAAGLETGKIWRNRYGAPDR